jgi:hypothetical protein
MILQNPGQTLVLDRQLAALRSAGAYLSLGSRRDKQKRRSPDLRFGRASVVEWELVTRRSHRRVAHGRPWRPNTRPVCFSNHILGWFVHYVKSSTEVRVQDTI